MPEVEWSDDGESVTCPYCGESWGDNWDYEWGQRSTIDIECPYCDKSLVLHRDVSVDYGVSVPATPYNECRLCHATIGAGGTCIGEKSAVRFPRPERIARTCSSKAEQRDCRTRRLPVRPRSGAPCATFIACPD